MYKPNLKQISLATAATVVAIATAMWCTRTTPELDSIEPEPIVTPVVREPELSSNECVDAMLEWLHASHIKADITHTTLFNGDTIILSEGALQVNPETSDCHSVIMTGTYTADAWYNTTTGLGYITMDNTINDDSVEWVPISDSDSTVMKQVFYATYQPSLYSTVEHLLDLTRGYYYRFENGGIYTRAYEEDTDIELLYEDDNLYITLRYIDSDEVTSYVLSNTEVYTDVPDICTTHVSSKKHFNKVWEGVKNL